MKNPTLSFDQCRRELRRDLFIQRQLDCDNTEKRLFNDAIKLDAQLVAKNYKLPYATEWGKSRAKSYQQVGMADLIFAGE
jgi:hypothetical protein